MALTKLLDSRPFVTAILSCLPAVAPADTAAVLRSSVETISASNWRISRLEAGVELTESGMRGEVRIGELAVPAAELSFEDVGIACGRIRLTTAEYRCDDARFTAAFPGIGRRTVPGWFVYERQTGVTRFELSRLPVAGGGLRIRGLAGETETRVEFDGERLQIEALVGIAGSFGAGLDELSASGLASASGKFHSGQDGVTHLELQVSLQDAAFSNASGTAVTDALQGDIALTAELRNNGWLVDLDVAADVGEAYLEPVYANLSEHAVRLKLEGLHTSDFRTFDIPQVQLQQDTLITLNGDIGIALPGDTGEAIGLNGRMTFSDTSVDAVYTGLLQILAAGTMLGELETSGRIAGAVTFSDSTLTSATLELEDLVLDDRHRRFAVYGLSGRIDWPGPDGEPGDATPSSLRWDSAAAYNIALGGGALNLRLGGDDVELLSPLRLPTMGGALVVNQLVMNNYGRDDASGLLDAELEPIQLGQLTGAFGWPAFSGSLSGRLPLLQYDGNAMTVGGRLTANAFDGNIEVANLRLEQPFGRVPRLYGDLRLKQLDLERITNTFSFGLIQGRLSGDVTGLEMLDWRPVAMDLHLYTPAGDKARHRISQRAVENLASVGGGGAAAALSSGLLKFFEVFAYDRIGLRCILKDGVCAMSGAGAAGDGPFGSGYYIVKGSGLPRIDVIGYRRQVSWNRLLQQLSGITRSDAPVVN